MSIWQTEGSSDITNKVLLETFAREFIKQLNLWAERGFDYIYNQWKIRLQNLNAQIELQTSKQEYAGIAKGVTTAGDLILEREDNDLITITIDEYMGTGK